MRHYLNLRIIFSLFTEYKTIGPYELDWAGEQFKSPLTNVITLGLLSALQALNLFWLFFIVRIAYRFVVHRVAEDDRSENEESEAETEQTEEQKPLLNGEAAKAPLLNGGAVAANGKARSGRNGSAAQKGAR